MLQESENVKTVLASHLITFSIKGGNVNQTKEWMQYVSKQLQSNGLVILEEVTKEENGLLVLEVSCTRDVLETIAEKENFVKRSVEGKLEYFAIKGASKFFENYESPDFFLPTELSYLLQTKIEEVKTTASFNELLKAEQQRVNIGDSLVYACKRMGFIERLQPKHLAQRREIWKETMTDISISNNLLNKIYAYYGSSIALYFAWLNHFTTWLIAPGIFGAIIAIHDFMSEDGSNSIDKSKLAPWFTLFIIIWSVLFIQFWKRKCAELCCYWGTTHSGVTRENMQHSRPEFYGKLKICPITNQPRRYYPYTARLLKYIGSAAISSAMLAVAFSVMVLSLNFQGYIHESSVGGAFLHFPSIHQFSLPGAIFDQMGGGPLPYVLPLVPSILHSIVIMQLNLIYRGIATTLTNWENHRTQQEFDNALIIKRFLFEAFDCYIALFYLAFCQVDIVLLRQNLVALYTAASIRRVATESVIPLVVQLLQQKVKNKDVGRSKQDDDTPVVALSPIMQELMQAEYELFDDYLEMVIQFGYITLFASAFPLASTLSIFCNLIEAKSDLFKLSFVMKRPRPERSDNIGIWLHLLTGMVWLSMLTNVFIFGFTTEQMLQVFPWMFRVEASDDVSFGGVDHTHIARLGMGRYVVGIVFFIEHVFMLIASAIFHAVPDTPEKITTEIHRREYSRKQRELADKQQN